MRFLLGLVFIFLAAPAFAETCADHLAKKNREASDAVVACFRDNSKTRAQCEDLRSKHQAVVDAVSRICDLTGYNSECEEPNCPDMLRQAESLVTRARAFCQRNPSSADCPGIVRTTEKLLRELKTGTCRNGRSAL